MAKVKVTSDWQIRNLDTEELLNPPYPVDDSGVRIDGVGGTYSEQPVYGAQDAILQWTAGKLKSFTFSTVLFAEDSESNIRDKLTQFENLALKNEDLGRPPICILSIGQQIAETVVVEDVGIEITSIMSDKRAVPKSDGYLREVRIDFAIKKYKPFSQKQIDPTKPGKESYYLVVSTPETSYEALGKKFYGKALYGDRIRKRHPEMPMYPEVGSKISIPPRSTILKEVVEPSFHAFDPDNIEATESYEALLKRRAERKIII